jgi:hypothetical protein
VLHHAVQIKGNTAASCSLMPKVVYNTTVLNSRAQISMSYNRIQQ